jgi:citrate lyase subunit beta/citryl-CoA lyase
MTGAVTPRHSRRSDDGRAWEPVTAGRSRRSCLTVPGSSPKMLGKAPGLPADEVILDLEDSVAPLAKHAARQNVLAALNDGGFQDRIRALRVNDLTTEWAYQDVIAVVEGAGSNLDCVVLPKVRDAADVRWLDILLTQVERAMGLEVGRIGVEAQIESAGGLVAADAIAASSPRLETLVFGPADFIASAGMRSPVAGEQPPGYDLGDAYHYALMRILMAARAHDLQAIDGPYLRLRDLDGLRRVAARSAALGFDGKWALHPDQIEPVNRAYSPRQEDYDHAEAVLAAYQRSTSEAGGRRGAVMLGDEMIDEASRKMALVTAAKGRAAGMRPTVPDQ